MNKFEEMQGWQKRSFEIMTAQALNLSNEVFLRAGNPKDQDNEESLLSGARFYFKLLLILRNDPELQDAFAKESGDDTKTAPLDGEASDSPL